MLDEHRLHGDVDYANKLVPKHLEVLLGFVPIADDAAAKAQETLNKLKADSEAMTCARDDTVQSVHSYFDRLRQILAKREEELVSKTHNQFEQKLIVIAKRQQVLQEAQVNVSKYGKHIKEMVYRRRDDVRVLLEEDTVKALLLSQAQTIEAEMKRAKNQRQQPLPSPFTPDLSFEELCRSAGARSHHSNPPSPAPRSRVIATRCSALPPRSPRVQSSLTKSESMESTATEYSEVPSRQWDFDDLDEERYVCTMTPTPPPTPPMRRQSHEKEAEICQPEMEIGPKNLSGSFFRKMTKEIYPCGVCVNSNGTIIVTDVRNHCFSILAPTGRCLEVIGSEGKGDGQFFEPTAVAVDKEGSILVTDKDPPRIQKFSQSGECVVEYVTLFSVMNA